MHHLGHCLDGLSCIQTEPTVQSKSLLVASQILSLQAFRPSLSAVNWSSSSQASSSVSVFFFLLSLIFFSISLIFFLASLALSSCFALTSILFPAPSYTSSCALLPEFCSSS